MHQASVQDIFVHQSLSASNYHVFAFKIKSMKDLCTEAECANTSLFCCQSKIRIYLCTNTQCIKNYNDFVTKANPDTFIH